MPLHGHARAFLVLASLAWLTLVLLGCDAHLGGTNDTILEYEAPETLDFADLRAGIQQRLLAEQIVADVEAIDGGRLRITLDAQSAPAAKELLRWHGGFMGFLVDRRTPVVLGEDRAPTLEKRVEDAETYWVGPMRDLRAAVRALAPIRGRRVLLEYLGDLVGRTRVVGRGAIIDFTDGSLVAQKIGTTDSGRTVGIALTAEAVETAQRAEARFPNGEVAWVRDVRDDDVGDVLAVQALSSVKADDLLRFSFGKDIRSYSYAYDEVRLLRTPRLPDELKLLSETAGPTRWGIATACILLPLALSFGWLFFVRRFDRARPEPMWLVVATFALGAVSVVPGVLLERWIMGATPYLNPSVMTLGGQLMGFPFAVPVFTVSVGLVEEGVKYVAAWSLARHRKEFDEPVDGIVYACASSLGFAALENMRYFGDTRLSSAVIVGRAFMSVPLHMFCGGIWGYAMGRKLVRPKTWVLPYFLLAALAHGLFDALLSLRDLSDYASLFLVLLAAFFVFLLRRSLRHGVIARGIFALEDDRPPESKDRVIVPMGRALPFAVSAFLMLGCAWGIIRFGNVYEISDHRVGAHFFVIGGVLLTCFGVAAYALASTIPLDVAIDPRGVTFAGAETRWEMIVSFERTFGRTLFGYRGWVILRTSAGVAMLGPAAAKTIERLATLLSAYTRERSPPSEAPATGPPRRKA